MKLYCKASLIFLCCLFFFAGWTSQSKACYINLSDGTLTLDFGSLEVIINNQGFQVNLPHGELTINSDGIVLEGENRDLTINSNGFQLNLPHGEVTINSDGIVIEGEKRGLAINSSGFHFYTIPLPASAFLLGTGLLGLTLLGWRRKRR